MRNESALALRSLSVGSRPQVGPRAREHLLGLADGVPAFVETLHANRMSPWVATAIASDPQLASMDICKPIVAAAGALTLRSLDLFAELARLVGRCNDRGVDLMVLKGPAVSRTYYPDAGLRPYGDIDILIRERDLVTVEAVLAGWGYKLKEDSSEAHRLHDCHGIFQRIYLHPENHRIVEVHLDHLQIGLEPVGMDEIWSRAIEMKFGRGVARILEPTDLFLQLCVHLHRHGFERLIWFKDLDLMIRADAVDWKRLEEQASKQGCRDSVSYTLGLLRRMLGTPLPTDGLELIASQSRLSRWLMRQTWPPSRVLALQPQRQWRLRRAVQFSPETGVLRGGLGSMFFTGRRADKLRVVTAALYQRLPSFTQPRS